MVDHRPRFVQRSAAQPGQAQGDAFLLVIEEQILVKTADRRQLAAADKEARPLDAGHYAAVDVDRMIGIELSIPAFRRPSRAGG